MRVFRIDACRQWVEGSASCVSRDIRSILTEATLDMNDVMIPNSTVRGIVEGDSVPGTFTPRLIDLYLKGRFPFDRLIKFYDLDQINEAAEETEEGNTPKPVLRMGR